MLKEMLNRFRYELKEEPNVLINEPEVMLRDLLEVALKDQGFKEVKSISLEEKDLQEIAVENPTILILSDAENLTRLSQIIENLKKMYTNLKIYLIIPYNVGVDLAKFFSVGADEIIQKPFSIEEFYARLFKLLNTFYLERKVSQLLTEDPVTSVYNRRYFETHLREEILRALRYQHPLTLLMIDLDKFKFYNDTYGHAEGDKVLHGIALLLCENIRFKIDKVCRYGGDEFVIILPHIDWKKAKIVVERIFKAYRLHPFEPVTLSVGIAQLIAREDLERSVSDLLNRADQAMYEAKKTAGNTYAVDETTIKVYGEEEAPSLAQPLQ